MFLHTRMSNLTEKLDLSIPEFYPGILVAVKTLLTSPVCTCTTERSFSMHEEAKDATSQCYVRCEVVLAIRNAYSQTLGNRPINNVIFVFAGRKDRRLALCL